MISKTVIMSKRSNIQNFTVIYIHKITKNVNKE